MLKLSGVRVDLDESRLGVAEIVIKTVESWSGGYGADCVLFTAATSSSAPLSQSFQMCKKKGKVGMEINRADIYQKELDFMISTSYGPGRYELIM